MVGPKDRQKQFIQERKSKLRPSDSENEGASKEGSQEEQDDIHQPSTTPGDHAEKVREYRERQKEKLRRAKHPRDSKG
jgi:hypothetical protein